MEHYLEVKEYLQYYELVERASCLLDEPGCDWMVQTMDDPVSASLRLFTSEQGMLPILRNL